MVEPDLIDGRLKKKKGAPGQGFRNQAETGKKSPRRRRKYKLDASKEPRGRHGRVWKIVEKGRGRNRG